VPLRACFREAISDIAQAAALLNAAVTAHLLGNTAQAQALIRQADMPPVAAWVEFILGKSSPCVVIHACGTPTLWSGRQCDRHGTAWSALVACRWGFLVTEA
jgi:hypothetical protein